MNRSHAVVRQIARVVGVSLVLALLIAGSMRQGSANQSGPTVNESTGFQIALCEAGGGTATMDSTRSVGSGLSTLVKCIGGLLGGMSCHNTSFGTICAFPSSGRADTGRVDPFNADQSIQATDIVAEPDADEDVVADVPEITADESVDPLPPVVDEGPLADTVPTEDIESVGADDRDESGQVVPSDVATDLPDIEVVDEPIVEESTLPQLDQIPTDIQEMEQIP